jgi:ferrochelatase
VRLAIVLYNLGGPDRPEVIRPFLHNLFSDRAIIGLPQPLRALMAGLIAWRRAPAARAIYDKIGGQSPILKQTEAQARALRKTLEGALAPSVAWSVFVAMRYWQPDIPSVVSAVKAFGPDKVLLLPLYPQFSTTTTGSFVSAWRREAARQGLEVATAALCCYPMADGLIAAHVALIRASLASAGELGRLRVLFSAHGLPERIVARGDPYAWQVERTAERIISGLALTGLEWRVCFQSRVGPLKWLEPSTEHEILRAAQDGKGVLVVPIAFVSEHAETLVELDMEYAAVAARLGVRPYLRVPALGSHGLFIDALRDMVCTAMGREGVVSASGARLCPRERKSCPCPSA